MGPFSFVLVCVCSVSLLGSRSFKSACVCVCQVPELSWNQLLAARSSTETPVLRPTKTAVECPWCALGRQPVSLQIRFARSILGALP